MHLHLKSCKNTLNFIFINKYPKNKSTVTGLIIPFKITQTLIFIKFINNYYCHRYYILRTLICPESKFPLIS